MKIGITGHQRLQDPSAWQWVESELRHLLQAEKTPLQGVSSLAIGADQLFARCVLDSGGSLTAIIPFPDYARTFEGEEEQRSYSDLLNRADEVQVLPDVGNDEESYLAAGKLVVKKCELLIAVWDGQAAKGKGGTGDAVEFARQSGRSVVHINPIERKVTRSDA